MAVYKSIGNVTHKFTVQKEITVVNDLTQSKLNSIEPLKVIIDGKSYYVPLCPTAELSADSGLQLGPTSFSDDANDNYLVLNSKDYINRLLTGYRRSIYTIDGTTYYGLNSAYYRTYIDYHRIANTYTSSVDMPIDRPIIIPKSVVKVLKYNTFSDSIEILEEPFEARLATSKLTVYRNSTGYIMRGFYLKVPKTEEDLVLAISFEYAKYDVDFTSTVEGLQYSLDEGETFEAVTSGLKLEQIDYITFKNVTASDIILSDNSGSTGTVTIAAGETKLVIPEADSMSWYVSANSSTGSGGSN